MGGFDSLHPAVAAVYFTSVLVFSMFIANPLMLVVSLAGGMLFFFIIREKAGIVKEIGLYFGLFCIISLTNPLFSHNGVTPLFFFNNNPVTLEALLYGVNLALTVISTVYWFKSLSLIFTEDKLLFLFGSLVPKTALLISSALSFVPRLKEQAHSIAQAQASMGIYTGEAWSDRLRGAVRVYSALVTRSLENAIDTAASMKARGYGLKGRTHYSLFRLRAKDLALLLVIAVSDGVIISVSATNRLSLEFYPSISFKGIDGFTLAAVTAFAVLCLLPSVLEAEEELKWQYYKSKI